MVMRYCWLLSVCLALASSCPRVRHQARISLSTSSLASVTSSRVSPSARPASCLSASYAMNVVIVLPRMSSEA